MGPGGKACVSSPNYLSLWVMFFCSLRDFVFYLKKQNSFQGKLILLWFKTISFVILFPLLSFQLSKSLWGWNSSRAVSALGAGVGEQRTGNESLLCRAHHCLQSLEMQLREINHYPPGFHSDPFSSILASGPFHGFLIMELSLEKA